MPQVMLNYVAIIVAGLVPMVLGMLWYSQSMFGKMWMKEAGMSAAEMEKAKKEGMGSSYGIALVGALIMSYVLAHFVAYLGLSTASDAAQLGFWIWIGFIATTLLDNVLWDKKSWTWYAIGASYKLVAIILMALIITLWQ